MKKIIIVLLTFFIQSSWSQTGDDLFLDNAKYLYAKTSTGTSTRVLGINGSNSLYLGSVDDSINNLFLNLNGLTRFSIDGTNGNVGIGTTNPGQKLHVEGNLRTTSANPNLSIIGTGTGNYQGATLILTAQGVTTGNQHASTWFMTHRGTDGTATLELQRRNITAGYGGIKSTRCILVFVSKKFISMILNKRNVVPFSTK